MAGVIIRPGAFLENFVPGFLGQARASVWRYRVDGNKMAVVSIEDIGVNAARAMVAVEDYRNAEINLAGDNLSLEEAGRIFAKETGGKKLPTTDKCLALMLIALRKDLKQMATFHKEKSAGADVQSERRK
jgi:hypothetical protein